jgi:PAS domain S-box-containing protein
MQTLDESFFTERIQTAYARTETLYRAVQESPQQSTLLLQCLEELQVSLAELEVAQEELHQQSETIVAAQIKIEAERQRYQDLFNFAPDGYLVTDNYGTVQEANCAAATMLHIGQQHLVGKPIITFIPEEKRRSFRNILNELPMLNRIQEWEVQMCGRGNVCFEAAVTVEVVRNPEGQVTALRWLIRDVTARKVAEEKLRRVQLQNVQLIEADRLRREFMATVTHELRTPMNAILGFSELLLRQFRTQAKPHQITMLERVLQNGQHLLMLIEDILDFSKLQANRLELRLQAIDLSELISAIVEELRPLADQKHLNFGVCLAQTHLSIVNDPLRLRQIVINLLSNAIKFTEAGSVYLEVLELPEGRIVILVRDTGIGIRPGDQEQIFQEFWQVNQTSTRSQGGTGLGLSITKALVDLMQGTISVESEVGAGTTFRVEIPRQILPRQGSDDRE